MKTEITSPESNLKNVATILNTLLADEYVLYLKTRNADWNIHRQNFTGLHKFFHSQYQSLEKIIDHVTTEVRKIGFYPLSSLGEFLSITSMFEENLEPEPQNTILESLAVDHETMIHIIQHDLDAISATNSDPSIAALGTELIDKHKKITRLLRNKISAATWTNPIPDKFNVQIRPDVPLLG
jgi:starvation-inducible DNA-binding protein